MKLLTIRTEDKRWLAARLRVNLRCMLGIGLLCAAIHAAPPTPVVPANTKMPIPTVVVAENGTKTVMPVGWRRTKNGWEHVSTWPSFGGAKAASINELIARQRDREPQWIRTAMARISNVPPLMVALIQITAIAAIVFVAESYRRDRESV